MSRPWVALEGLTIAYGDTVVVPSLNLVVYKGEMLVLLGPSGCGKTTTMRAIAGLVTPRSGTVRISGVDVTRLPANRRNVGLVFQSYALFPHLNAYENVAFGLRLKRLPGQETRRRALDGLATVGLESFADRKPMELSGGQQQRLALARSLVMNPDILMLDEPFSNLDARLRIDMRSELQRFQRMTGLTVVFVTHDQSEALALADRIVLMKDGRIEQIGTPEQIYHKPESAFVADFVGFENIFKYADGKLFGDQGNLPLRGGPAGHSLLAWRPEDVSLGIGVYKGRVTGTAFAGQRREYLLDSRIGRIKVSDAASNPACKLGDEVPFSLEIADAVSLPTHDGRRT